MPSQEDYLDQLLKGLAGDAEGADEDVAAADPAAGISEDTGGVGAAEKTDRADAAGAAEFDFDIREIEELLKAGEAENDAAVSGLQEPDAADPVLSEEQIEQMLRTNRMEESDAGSGESAGTEDLMSLLEQAGEDSNLQDIHDMLQKSDNNETVEEDLIAMLQELPDAESGDGSAEELSELLGEAPANEEGELTERQRKALEKKRIKEEKAAAKRAAKEAKKAGKRAKKLGGTAAGGETADAQLTEDRLSDGELSMDPALQEEPMAMDRILQEEPIAVDVSAGDALLNLSIQSEAAYNELAGEVGTVDFEQGVKEKKGLFSKILDFLTEEDEEEEEENRRGTEDIPLSDENRQVLEEMDQERPGKKGRKNKKGKKDKKGKGRTAAGEDAGDEEIEDGGDGRKAQKARKPKKEKTPKEKEPRAPGGKIPVKKLLPILLAGISLLLVIMLLVNFGGEYVVKREARKAYYEEDYETCYQELYGKTLSESEQVMFGKSESILRIRLWMREYELFAGEGAETEALDVLIQSVNDYAKLYEYAVKWNAGDDVSEIYGRILDILQDKYGLTEAQALEIAAEPDDVEYTRLVTAVAGGTDYGSMSAESAQGRNEQPDVLPDMLPEEERFPENNGGR